jgi:hypothetical protein
VFDARCDAIMIATMLKGDAICLCLGFTTVCFASGGGGGVLLIMVVECC